MTIGMGLSQRRKGHEDMGPLLHKLLVSVKCYCYCVRAGSSLRRVPPREIETWCVIVMITWDWFCSVVSWIGERGGGRLSLWIVCMYACKYIIIFCMRNNNNLLDSSQQEIKAVVQFYTLTHNEELNCTYCNYSKSWNTHTHTYTLLDIHPLSLSLHMPKHWSNT